MPALRLPEHPGKCLSFFRRQIRSVVAGRRGEAEAAVTALPPFAFLHFDD